jgi:hypothetical protein
MAYVTQFDVDNAARADWRNSMNQLGKGLSNAVDTFEENRRRALDERRAKMNDMAQLREKYEFSDAQYDDYVSGKTPAAGLFEKYSPRYEMQIEQDKLDREANRQYKLEMAQAAKARQNLPVQSKLDEYKAKKQIDAEVKNEQDKSKLIGKDNKEFESRLGSIIAEADNVKSLINDKGTFETLGPHNQILSQKIDSIAIDAAKLFDPQSVARDSEVAAFRKMLFEPGSLTTSNDTALGTVDSFKKLVEDRAARERAMVQQMSNGQPVQAPAMQPAPEQKFQRLQELRAKKAQMQGGY